MRQRNQLKFKYPMHHVESQNMLAISTTPFFLVPVPINIPHKCTLDKNNNLDRLQDRV